MRGVTLIILHAFVAQLLAQELEANHSTHELGDMLVNKMVSRLLGAPSLQRSQMDDATFAKTQMAKSFGPPSSRVQTRSLLSSSRSPFLKSSSSYSKTLDSLPGPYALKKAAIDAIEANNRACRDISVRATDTSRTEKGYPGRKKLYRGEGERLTKEQVEKLPGVTAPAGLFDPLGFSTKTPEGTLLYYREAEIKHGRVCMLASIGILDQEFYHPLFGGNIDVPAAKLGGTYIQETQLADFWPAALISVGLYDLLWTIYSRQPERDSIPNWDLGWDPLKIKPKDPKEWYDMQTKELNNGRLAMIGTAGMLVQELVTGQKAIDTPVFDLTWFPTPIGSPDAIQLR